MANKRIDMLKVRKTLQLLVSGTSSRQISRRLKMGRHTVSDYLTRFSATGLSYADLLSLDDHTLNTLLFPPQAVPTISSRQQDLQSRLPRIALELKRKGVTKGLLWQEYKQECPDGYGHSQFCEHLSRYLEQHHTTYHNIHVAGETLQVDFAGDKLFTINPCTGQKENCEVLVCTLPYSGLVYVEALPDGRQEHLYRALSNCLSYLGGVPRNILSDNMKQYVTRPNRYEPTFSHLADQWSVHYNTCLNAARVRKPRDKAHVESHVNIVYNRIYAPLRNEEFTSLQSLNIRIWELLEELNNALMYQRSYSRRERFTREEYPQLQPLPATAFMIRHRRKAKVMASYHVLLGEDMHYYSVPWQYTGKQVTIVYNYNDVEIYLDLERIATHSRHRNAWGYTTLEEHMPASHQAYHQQRGWDADYFIQRAGQIGPDVKLIIEKILSSRYFMRQAYNRCMGIFRLGEVYGNDRLINACKRAAEAPAVSYGLIRNILEKNRDKIIGEEIDYALPEHENTRGAEYYQ